MRQIGISQLEKSLKQWHKNTFLERVLKKSETIKNCQIIGEQDKDLLKSI